MRRSRGLTRAQLTNSIGEKQETVSGWERGKEAPGVVTIVKLSDALQVSINYLSNNCFIQIQIQQHIRYEAKLHADPGSDGEKTLAAVYKWKQD